MQWLSSVLLTIQVVASLAIIVLVLLQQGKGADMGSSFGSGSAGSLFGASGAANFLSRTTRWAAIVFFASTAGLAYLTHRPAVRAPLEGGVMQGFEPSTVPGGLEVPQAPGVVPVVPSTPPADAAVPAAVSIPAVPTPAAPAASAASSAAPEGAATPAAQ